MLHDDLIGFGLFLGCFVVAGLPLILLTRKSDRMQADRRTTE
jgi:hypothetical protein